MSDAFSFDRPINVGDVAAIRRAVRQKWDIPPEARAAAVRALKASLVTATPWFEKRIRAALDDLGVPREEQGSEDAGER